MDCNPTIEVSPRRHSAGDVSSRRFVAALVAITLLALTLRLWRCRQSLWCDEMAMLLDYASHSWKIIVAAGPEQYVPNDHVLYALLAKAMLAIGTGGQPKPADTAALFIRLPALIAGTIVPFAAAWPM